MKFFIDPNGDLQNFDELTGKSSIPYNCSLDGDKIEILDSEGFVLETCQAYNSLEEMSKVDESLEQLLMSLYTKLYDNSEPMPADFARILSENITELF